MHSRIVASLRFVEEESHVEPVGVGDVQFRSEPVQRLVELEIQFSDTGNDSTIIQFDFYPKAEGLQWFCL